jgi:hypothetical protein
MATTTNYGWDTPDDTDLVKDGAAAIRTLGSSVDTTTKALNPSTTLGDIEYRSATANTNTRLGIGSDGQYLTITSGVPAWAAISVGGMTLLSTTSLSGTTTTVSSIDQTYNNLAIIVQGATWGTGNSIPQFRFNGGTNILATGVQYKNTTTSLHTTTSIFNINNNSQINNNADNVYNFEITNYANTTRHKGVKHFCTTNVDDGGTIVYAQNQLGSIKTNSAITSFSVTTNDGYTFDGGQILIYGVK